MRTKVKLISFLLFLTLLLAVVPVWSFAADETGSTSLLTSYCSDDHLQLSISGSTLTVSGAITCRNLDSFSVKCTTGQGGWIAGNTVSTSSGRHFSTAVRLTGDEPIFFTAYCNLKGDNFGNSYTWNRIIIEKTRDGYVFAKSSVLENNDAFLSQWINPADWKGNPVSEEIKELSDTIVGTATDDYAKCFKLNRWVAENIYYDMDYYTGKASSTSLATADILLAHKSICEGYARLLRELLHAQNIPAFTSSVYALGVSSDGGSFGGNRDAGTRSNHAIVEAFADGRWIIMDPTWDSNNVCRDNTYTEKPPYGFYYFDITPEAFALDHQYFSRGPISLRDGKAVNDTDASRIPSSWAQSLVCDAIGEGLVPDAYQKYYSAPISRASMCRLAVEMMQQKTGKTISEVMREKKVSAQGISFADTTDSNVLACKALGIVDGVGKDSSGNAIFRPEASLTRAQAAVIAAKAASVLGIRTSGFESTFRDVPATHWCASFAGWAAAADIVSGRPDGTFDPDGTLTLEQAIIIIYKTLKATEQ